VDKKYDYVICGHIHHSEIREIQNTDKTGSVLYLNSGDWVESLTSLEYMNGQWSIHKFNPDDYKTEVEDDDKTDSEDLDAKMNVIDLLERFKQEAH